MDDGLQQRLAAAGYEVEHGEVGGRQALIGRRSDFHWRWFATRLHTFVVAFALDDLDDVTAEGLTGEALRYAVDHKGGLPRGWQTGSVAVATFVVGSAPGMRPWFERKPEHRFAALRWPVLLERDTGEVTYFHGRMRVGGVYAKHLRGVAEDVVRP